MLWLNSLAQPLRPNKSFFDAEQENDIIVDRYPEIFQYKKEEKNPADNARPIWWKLAALNAWINHTGMGVVRGVAMRPEVEEFRKTKEVMTD